jgi:DNA (cytosine-5)-methyltransferase 3A
MSVGRIALQKLGITPSQYLASEIDKHAIKVSKVNWDDVTHIGDVTKVSYSDGILYTENGDFEVGRIDLLIGGSPCQDFSTAKAFGQHGTTPQGLEGTKSGLFYHYLRIKKEIELGNPRLKFLLENVKMKRESKEQLDNYLGVEGIYINSDLVSFQKRARYYWTNLLVVVPEDKGISFQDYKESGDLSKYKLNPTPSRLRMWGEGKGNNGVQSCANVTNADKVYCLTTKQDRCPNSGLVEYEDFCRFLTQRELEAAQTVPIGYTSCLSYNQACAVLGNGWTADVIVHIFKGLKEINLNQFVEYTNDEQEETSTIGNWIDHDAVGASHMLGEDIYSAVVEALGHDCI